MLTVKQAAKLFTGRGPLTNDMIREIVLNEKGIEIPYKNLAHIKQKIHRAVYIESKQVKKDGRTTIEVIKVGRKTYNEKKRKTNKLKDYYREHGRKEPYKYYAEMFGLSAGCAYQCWREVKDEMPKELYQARETMKLINEVWR